MTLNLSIMNALSGLRVAQRAFDTVSQNVANAQTPGYTRKVLPQESTIVGGTGAGVRALELERVVDANLQQELRRQWGTLAGQDVTESYLARIEQLQGRPEDETSLASAFTRFQTAFEKLSATPEQRSAQLDVITQADSLASQLNSVSQQILDLRNQTQDDIQSTVQDINGRLRRIGELNDKIVEGTQMGRSTADLEDLRDQEMMELGKLMDVSTVRTTDNRMIVMTRSGQTLVERTVQQFDFVPERLNHDSYYRASPPGTISGITLRGSGRDVTSVLGGGTIGALLDLRDATLPKLQAQMDEFAQKMAQRFEAQGMTLFTDRNGGVPQDVLGGYVGFAASIQVTAAATDNPEFVRYGDSGPPASPPDMAVANSRIMNILNYAFGNSADAGGSPHAPFRTSNLGPDAFAKIGTGLPATMNLADYIRSLVVSQGQMRADVTAMKAQTEELTTALESKVSNMSGVNLDTEMAQMTILQRSYAASAQILQVSQQLMDELLAAVR